MESIYKYFYNGINIYGYNLNNNGYIYITSGLTIKECREKANKFFKSLK